jgi:predicted SnoaL-like aldol condensation-catalyzing enzyme
MLHHSLNKQSAVEFLQLASSGQVRDAFARYVGPNFHHHNPYFPGDAHSLAEAMAQNAAENPDKMLEVKHALEEGDLVAVHSRMRLKPGALEVAVVHIFRFADARIVELWDINQASPAELANPYGMF